MVKPLNVKTAAILTEEKAAKKQQIYLPNRFLAVIVYITFTMPPDFTKKQRSRFHIRSYGEVSDY